MAYVPAGTKTQARASRSMPTDAERTLWRMLRSRQLDGRRFRRQHPVPPFVLDFACMDAMLAVEADGGQHNGSAHDTYRDHVLRGLGWRILRFWNTDSNPEGVAETIRAAFAGVPAPGPHPNPPPSSTGEGTEEASP